MTFGCEKDHAPNCVESECRLDHLEALELALSHVAIPIKVMTSKTTSAAVMR